MFRRSIFLASFAFVLGLVLTSVAKADLVAYWSFDEGTGTIAADVSGNGYDATFNGNPTWQEGILGQALAFDGSSDYLQASVDNVPIGSSPLTVAAWIWPTAHEFGTIVSWGVASTNQHMEFRLQSNGRFRVTFYGNPYTVSTGDLTGEWNHVAGVHLGDGQRIIYFNGEAVGSPGGGEAPDIAKSDVFIGRLTNGQRSFPGLIDNVQIYNHALSETEVLVAMEGSSTEFPLAKHPNPADGAIHSDTWVNLSWSPGDSAVSHDVYLGDNISDVENATRDSDVFRGNQISTFYVAGFPGFAYPDGLVPGTTYYWRIDEVNDADPNSPWKGDVWSFSIAPRTAYNPNPSDGAEFVGPDNVTLSWTPGFGAILHTVYFGDDYDEVNNATAGIPAGTTSYSPGQLEREKVYYWRVDEFDAIATHKGDIWTFTTPGAVGNPQPANGAADVAMATILSWTPSTSAASHQIYFGTDKEAVRTAGPGSPEDKGSKALGAESYDPGMLDANTTYYWRVDEVDAQGNVLEGPVWVFTTGAFLLIDGFESYTDDDANNEAIWQHWIDGFGVADNGSQVGNLLPPYAEQTIVHGGVQSMPLFYTNEGGVTNSEATLTLTTPRDWTLAGVSELSVWYRGVSSNAADPLYVAVSNSAGAPAIVANDDPGAATAFSWTQWRILLQAFGDQGINLTNVDKLAIGLGSKGGAAVGGTGTMYIDDIRLYRP